MPVDILPNFYWLDPGSDTLVKAHHKMHYTQAVELCQWFKKLFLVKTGGLCRFLGIKGRIDTVHRREYEDAHRQAG